MKIENKLRAILTTSVIQTVRFEVAIATKAVARASKVVSTNRKFNTAEANRERERERTGWCRSNSTQPAEIHLTIRHALSHTHTHTHANKLALWSELSRSLSLTLSYTPSKCCSARNRCRLSWGSETSWSYRAAILSAFCCCFQRLWFVAAFYALIKRLLAWALGRRYWLPDWLQATFDTFQAPGVSDPFRAA